MGRVETMVTLSDDWGWVCFLAAVYYFVGSTDVDSAEDSNNSRQYNLLPRAPHVPGADAPGPGQAQPGHEVGGRGHGRDHGRGRDHGHHPDPQEGEAGAGEGGDRRPDVHDQHGPAVGVAGGEQAVVHVHAVGVEQIQSK